MKLYSASDSERYQMFMLEDCTLFYAPYTNIWTGTWADGRKIGSQLAFTLAHFEGLCWPDGKLKG